MNFVEKDVKGIARYLFDADLQEKDLRIHISEVGPGERSHPPHRHGGFEGFYILEGDGILEIDGERYPLTAQESAVFDPRKLHGLAASEKGPMRYMVIRAGDDV